METLVPVPNHSRMRRCANVLRRLGMALPGILMMVQSYAQQPPTASVSVKVQVPASMRTAPFNVDRYLTVPPDFAISVYARVSKPRFMAIAPNGDLLVSQPSTGKVLLVRPNSSGDPLVSNFATSLRNPHDIVFHTIGTTTYVYIAESHQINRYVYNSGDLTAHDRQIVVAGLPDASTPELQGNYGHQLKNVALDGNHKLYVSIASTCNACLSDTQSDPIRGAIYQYDADGSNRRLFAQGLRNAEGLAFVPGTNNLWVVVNNRDDIAYPFDDDFDGDGTNDYGKVLPSYVDNHPPEEFTYVQDGGNYGWPFCNPNPDNMLVDMPFDQDYELNANGQVDCNGMTRISRGIQAHSAPLGLTFLQGTNFANAYQTGAAVPLHGSWNRTQKTGYRVAYFPWNSTTQTPANEMNLVTGFLNEANQSILGRPVDVAVDLQGNMFISDDYSNTIYKLSYQPVALRTPDNPASTLAGLNYRYYEGDWNALPDFNALSPVKSGPVTNFSLAPRNRNDYFGFTFTGYVNVPADGNYTFFTNSDDGSKLFIGNTLVVNNDGLHPPQEQSGSIGLKAGKHAITVTLFEKAGGEVLSVSWSGPGIAKQAIPASALFRTAPPANATVKINFQPATSPVPAGYLADAGAVYGNRGNGYSYGWNAATNETRDRQNATVTDQRYNTLNHLQKPSNPNATWEIGLPNGTYKVDLTCGDPNHTDQINTLSVEGTVLTDPDGQDNFDAYSVTVTVSDGRLTIKPATGSQNAKLNFVDVAQTNGSATAARVATRSEGKDRLSVYPNPAQETFTLTYEAKEPEMVQVVLSSVGSRTLSQSTRFARPGTNYFTVQSGTLPSGTYLVSVRNRRRVLVEKVVVRK